MRQGLDEEAGAVEHCGQTRTRDAEGREHRAEAIPIETEIDGNGSRSRHPDVWVNYRISAPVRLPPLSGQISATMQAHFRHNLAERSASLLRPHAQLSHVADASKFSLG
jgi:hypothetical protein